VDVAYFRYFRDLELVTDYTRGDVALAHMYKELINGFHDTTKHMARFLFLLHV